MKQIRRDLWQIRPYSPMSGMTTHAYLWTAAPGGNVLFCSTGTDDDFADLDALGGIAHQYLTQRDEAGDLLWRSRGPDCQHSDAADRVRGCVSGADATQPR